MSNEDQKVKHSKRIQQKNNYIQKQTKIAKVNGIPVENPHMFAKHAAMDCVFQNVQYVLIQENSTKKKQFKNKDLNKL